MWQILRAVKFGLVCSLGLVVLLLLPALYGFVPENLRTLWTLGLVCVGVYALVVRLATTKFAETRLAERVRDGVKRLDVVADRALQRGLARALGLLCLGLLLIWIPQYLTWPWFRDTETFAVLAQSWDRGILPYRDIKTFNLPGAIYLGWTLGKVFGWGHTLPLYAFDAGCVVFIGLVMVSWSRRNLGGALPGLIGYLAFLNRYLNLRYEVIAQRDWHAAFLLCVGLLLMQTWPGRRARLASAVTAALALAIRPHAVLFLPALVWEAAQRREVSASGWADKTRTAAIWCVWFGLFVVLALAPLVVAGIFDDLIRQLQGIASVGTHYQATPGDKIHVFLAQFGSWRNVVPLAATVLLAAQRRSGLSKIATSWSLVWLGASFYRPIHLVHHDYLMLPVLLVSSITLALAVSWSLSSERVSRPILALVLVLLLYDVLPVRLILLSVKASVEAVRCMMLGEMCSTRPMGCVNAFPERWAAHRWADYCALLAYLRKETSPGSAIANVLNAYPYETINGPVGRLSPFKADSGIAWMTQVKGDLDPEFAQSLLDSTDSVVVWDSRQLRVDEHLQLERLIAVIREYYEPAAKFGGYEVWRRKAREND